MNTTRIYKDRIIGLLFLGAFLCYGIGRNLFESQNNSEQIIGSFLIILNSIFVVYTGYCISSFCCALKKEVKNDKIKILIIFFNSLYFLHI